MPGRLSRDQRRARTRRRLLDAAMVVFARQGFHAATLDGIADEAGFTKGAVYSNFEGKEDLFLGLLEERVEDRIDEVRAAFRGVTALDDVREGGRLLAEQVSGDRDLWFLFFEFWGYAARHDRLRGRLADLYGRWRAQVGDLVAEAFDELGLALAGRPEDTAITAIALSEGLALQRLVDPERVTAEHYADAFATIAAGAAAAGLGVDLGDPGGTRRRPGRRDAEAAR